MPFRDASYTKEISNFYVYWCFLVDCINYLNQTRHQAQSNRNQQQ